MRIAIATDDGKVVRKGHFGDARVFVVYEGEKLVELRDNPYTDEALGIKQHDVPEKAKLIDQLLSDCQILVGAAHGKKNMQRLEQVGKRFVRVAPGTPVEKALKEALR